LVIAHMSKDASGLVPRLKLQPVQVMTGHADSDGRLVLADEQLVAVLVRLEDEEYGPKRGGWFLEAGFGPCGVSMPPVFATLDDAVTWLTQQLKFYALGVQSRAKLDYH
jgi:hypothetical protein